MTVTQPAIDEQAVEEFAGRVVADVAATTTTALTAIGDKLGLWRALADGGPATSAELAARAGAVERYVREWCSALASAGYLEHEDGCFSLSPEHALVLAYEDNPAYLAGAPTMVRGMLANIDGVEQAFRDGGGVPINAYGESFWSGLERATGTGFDHGLVQEWIPAVEGLEERLTEGALVADVGCGTGRALIRMAEAFPNSVFHGYDVAPAAVEQATRAAEEAGVADRVAIRQYDATGGLPERYDVICTFDVLHDSRDPRGMLAGVRGSLRPDGVYLVLEIACHDHLDDNAGPIGTVMFGYSVLYCMTTSLAADGAGLGTCGLPEGRLRELCLESGFSSVAFVAENPFSRVYAVRP